MCEGLNSRVDLGPSLIVIPGTPRLCRRAPVMLVFRPGNPWYVFSVGFRESGFQTVVARASRPCVGCTIRTGGTPVPLPWKRSGHSNFVCLTACQAREWLKTYNLQGFRGHNTRNHDSGRSGVIHPAGFPAEPGVD